MSPTNNDRVRRRPVGSATRCRFRQSKNTPSPTEGRTTSEGLAPPPPPAGLELDREFGAEAQIPGDLQDHVEQDVVLEGEAGRVEDGDPAPVLVGLLRVRAQMGEGGSDPGVLQLLTLAFRARLLTVVGDDQSPLEEIPRQLRLSPARRHRRS